MSLKSKLWIGTLLLTSTAVFAAPAVEAPIIAKLKDVRDQLHAETYTAEERQLVADQAYMFINNMYVHRELKIKDFGPSADAVSRLKDIRLKAKNLSDVEFHTAMQLIFRDLRDNHTNYIAPLPLRCSYVIAPMVFRDVVEDGQVKIIFERLARIAADVPGDIQNAKPLDELVAVDGMPIREYMKNEILPNSMGANDSAQIVYGLMNHTIRSLSSLPVPAKDTITYTLKGSSGATYEIKTDLLAIVNEASCAEEAKKESARADRRIKFSNNENPTVKVWKKFAAPEEITPFDDNPLNEIAKIADLSTPAGKITFMKLFSFMPESSSIESLVHSVKVALVERRDQSDALIIDLRGNGGGAVKLAEELVQLFTPSVVEPMPVRMLPNDLNLNVFLRSNGGSHNGWTQDVEDALTAHAAFTKPRVLTTAREANRFGQVWFKPVIVLTDAACYSACDLFAAGMQDHGAATIIGTHPSTGAGGANVMEYRNFSAVFGAAGQANPFTPLPGSQAFRVSWRQTVRVGKNAGALIEDRGVIPDIVIHYTRDDLATGASKALMHSVRREVEKLLPRYKSSIKLASSVRIENGKAAKWSEEVKGVDTLDVMLAGKLVKSYKVSASGQNLDIQLDTVGTWESKRFDLVGKQSGKIAFRVVREIFWRGEDVVVGSDNLIEDFTKELKYIKTFVAEGKAEDAWQTSEGTLRVGKGPKYHPSIVSEAFLPLDLTQTTDPVAFVFNLALESEDGMDTFNLIERNTETGEEKYIITLDGNYDMGRQFFGYPLNKEKKHVEMVLEFESDENWNMTGPVVRALGIAIDKSKRPDERNVNFE